MITGNCTFVVGDDGLTISHQYAPADARSIAEHILAATVAQDPPPDPLPSLWSKTVLQTDFEGDGSATSILDDTGRHTLMGLGSDPWSLLQTEFKLFGGSSHRSWNENGILVANSADFDLALDADSAFLVEYWMRQSNVASTYEPIGNSSGTGQGFSFRHNGPHLEFAWFDSDGIHRGITVQNIGWVANGAGARVAIGRNSAGVYRVYLNGAMKHKVTPANGRIKSSTQSLRINRSGAGAQSWMDALRIINGAEPYDSDDGYNLAPAPFPVG